jgi:hypothetical protein
MRSMRIRSSVGTVVRKVSVPTLLAGMVLGAACAGGGAIAAHQITGAGIKDFSLSHRDIKSNTLKSRTMKNNSIKGKDIANGSVEGKDVADFGLSNEDIGVLTANVSADGLLGASSGGVTVTKSGVGQYQVDFARDITACVFLATVGRPGTGAAEGQAGTGKQPGNIEGVLVETQDSGGGAANKPFSLAVIC